MSLAVPLAPGGRPACLLGTTRLVPTPSPCRARVCPFAHRQAKVSGLLLPALPGQRTCVRVFASLNQQPGAQKDFAPFLAPLPEWCHRLTGAFLLIPFFFFVSGNRHAFAQPVRSPGLDNYPAASVRPNPLFESSALDVRISPQARAAAALATAMVGYGFVRSGAVGGSSRGGGGGGPGSLRSSVVAGAAASSLIEAPPMPTTPRARTERLDQLYYEIEDLKRRNTCVWEIAMAMMERDASLSVTAATVRAAESMDLDNPAEAAAAAIAANSATAELIAPPPPPDAAAAAAAAAGVPIRPSGGASRSLPGVSMTMSDVTATAAASVAAAVATEAGVPLRPSGGASRLSYTPPGLPGSPLSDTRVPPVPFPERPGGASARAGPPPPSPSLQLPPDSSRIKPMDDLSLAAWAGEVLEKTANSEGPAGQPPLQSSASASTPGKLSSRFTQIFDNPLAEALTPPPPPPRAEETFRPSMRPTRRASGAGSRPQPRTYRAITPPSLPQPPERPHPSFDVPENSLSPEDFLREADGRTADGRVNPSFASTSLREAAVGSVAAAPGPVAAAPAAAAPAAAPEAPTAAPEAPVAATATSAAAVSMSAPPAPPAAEPAWYNPLSWFTQRADTDGGAATNPSFDASLAVIVEAQEAEEQAAATAAAAAAIVVSEPRLPPPPPQSAPSPSPSPPQSLAASIVQVAEELGQDAGVGAAAAASAAAWSDALTEGAVPGDFTPVEQVAELLEVAMKTEEFTSPKYDPLRDAVADATAPYAAHKYDMVRGLVRSGRQEEEEERSAGAVAAAATAAEGEQQLQTRAEAHKYDLLYDLLQSVRTSGDPAAILATTDPKYDPVWSLLNMREPARGSLSKYDLVGAMLQAALAASPQPSRYDPLQVLLQAQPITGHSKYCLASVLLHGGWQEPLESGLADLPSWDPLSSVVGSSGSSRTTRGTVPPRRGRRTVSKYDMVGQALEAAASLPEDLASGKWASSQPRDPLLKSRPRQRTTAPRRQQRSKYDMVGQALESMTSLPEDLSSGKWASSQGRELFVDTLTKTVEEGGWAFLRRLRHGGAVAFKAVAAAATPVGNLLAKAVRLPYEVAPEVMVEVERPPLNSEEPERIAGVAGFPGLGVGKQDEAAPAAAVVAEPAAAVVAVPAAAVVAEPAAAVVAEPAAAVVAEPAAAVVAEPAAAVVAEPAAAVVAEPAAAVVAEPAAAVVAVPAAASTAAPGEMIGRGTTEELPAVLYQFKDVAGSADAAAAIKARKSVPVTVTSRRRQRGVVPPSREVVPAAAMAPPASKLERAVVPPSRITARRGPGVMPPPPAAAVPQAASPVEVDVPVAAPVAAASAAAAPSVVSAAPEGAAIAAVAAEAAAAEVALEAVLAEAPAADAAAASAAAAVAASAAAVAPEEAAATADAVAPQVPAAAAEAAAGASTVVAAVAAAEPAASAPVAPHAPPALASAASLKLSELAVDLLVVMSVQGRRGGTAPTQADLVGRFGDGFADVASQLRSLRGNAALLRRHPPVARLVRAASASASGDDKGMWSHLYDMLGAVRDAEVALPAFLEDCRRGYPLLHGLLTTGDAGQGVSVLCTLCNLLPVEYSAEAKQ